MSTGSFKGILLSTLIIASLMVPLPLISAEAALGQGKFIGGAYDAAKNAVGSGIDVMIEDLTPPTITIIRPENGMILKNVEVDAEISDDVGVENAYWTINDVLDCISYYYGIENVTFGARLYGLDGGLDNGENLHSAYTVVNGMVVEGEPGQYSVILVNGNQYTLTVYASDTSGNIGSSSIYFIFWGDVGASVTANTVAGQIVTNTENYSPEIKVTAEAIPDKLTIEISSDVPRGRTIAVDIGTSVLPISEVKQIVVMYDGKEIGMADNYADVLNPNDEDVPEYLVLLGARSTQVLVSIPHFSTHTIMITRRGEGALGSLWIIVIALLVVAIVVVAALYMWRRLKSGENVLREIRKELEELA